jgi:8-amino-7-oxononanoate synthase
MTLFARWNRLLTGLREQGRYRELTPPAGQDFSSNDYLGYGGGRRAEAEPSTTLSLHSSGAASRLLRGQHPIWDEVESALAAWHGAESALVMTSGYVANEGLLSTVIGPDDWVASDECNHASIIDGLRLGRAERFVYRHGDLNHLEAGMRDIGARRKPGRELFVVTESHFGMEGDFAPLAPLVELAGRFGAHVIVDEAHATGCIGPCGGGLVDSAGLRPGVLATVHTGGKALGVMGAYICGSTRLRELLVNSCRHLIFTTALPPMLGPIWLSMAARVQRDAAGRELLDGSAAHFRQELARRGIAVGGRSYIVPIVLGDEARAVLAASRLQRLGWDVRAIRPPSVPPGTARLRVSVHADHHRERLTALAAALAAVLANR